MDMKLAGVNVSLALTVLGLLNTVVFSILGYRETGLSGLLFYAVAALGAFYTFDMAKIAWKIATGRRKYVSVSGRE